MSPTIARAVRSDRDSLVELMRAQLEEHGIPVPARLGEFIDAALASDERGRFFVARARSGVIGAAWMSWAFPLEISAKVAWLEELYVLPAQRERGVGTALLSAVIAEAHAAGCITLDLEIESKQRRVARLYARHGFKPHPREHWTLRLDSSPER